LFSYLYYYYIITHVWKIIHIIILHYYLIIISWIYNFVNLRTSEVILFSKHLFFYWHFVEIIWNLIFLVFYKYSLMKSLFSFFLRALLKPLHLCCRHLTCFSLSWRSGTKIARSHSINTRKISNPWLISDRVFFFSFIILYLFSLYSLNYCYTSVKSFIFILVLWIINLVRWRLLTEKVSCGFQFLCLSVSCLEWMLLSSILSLESYLTLDS